MSHVILVSAQVLLILTLGLWTLELGSTIKEITVKPSLLFEVGISNKTAAIAFDNS